MYQISCIFLDIFGYSYTVPEPHNSTPNHSVSAIIEREIAIAANTTDPDEIMKQSEAVSITAPANAGTGKGPRRGITIRCGNPTCFAALAEVRQR